MKDPRVQKLAGVLLNHSIQLKSGENVLIEAFDMPPDLVKELVRQATEMGARPYVWIKQNTITRELLLNASPEQLDLIGKMELRWMKQMDCYIGIRGSLNVNELSDVPPEKMRLYEEHILKPVHFQERVNNTRWVILRYPSPSFAQQATMSTDAFEDFFFDVCTLDYSRMDRAMQPLIEIMRRTDKVHIKGPNTDLHFSIKGIPVVGCAGTHNIPDGEVFTAPVRDSVNGYIQFNTPTIYQGVPFSDVYLRFEQGKIVEARADKTERLNRILDTDEGARYIGEFALGFNPYVTRPMLDILFDEKMAGSFHFTPGNAYEDADNGNRSGVHWDMVMRQTPEVGGGEIYFDGELIRKDGRFVPPALQGLNPEHLQ
ncbi:MAG: aminopeptidase [Calditrichaeota bacterium]|nr:MAG: aminopeptidase [Calditrichota bacterium]